MNRVISSLDWQRLSDYLDKQLSPSDVIELEEEIQHRQEFQDALNELKATKFLLQSLPRRRAPHNFTLAARDLPAPRFHFSWLPGLSLATVLSTLALIFTLFYQPLVPAASAPQTLSMAAQAAPMQAEAADEAAAATEAQPAPIIVWGAPPMVAMGKGGGGGGDGNAEMQVYAAPPPENVTQAPALVAPAAPAPKEAENASPASEPSTAVESPPITGNGPILGVRPTAEQGQEINRYPEESGLNAASTRSIQEPQSSNDLFYIQLLLACLSVSLALSTFIYWLRQRR